MELQCALMEGKGYFSVPKVEKEMIFFLFLSCLFSHSDNITGVRALFIHCVQSTLPQEFEKKAYFFAKLLLLISTATQCRR